MIVQNYHKLDNRSILSKEIPTPLELYKKDYGKEKYNEVMKFYDSDEWKKFDREQLNSDRRYYETRKDHLYDPEQKIIERNPKNRDYHSPQPFQLRIEAEELGITFNDIYLVKSVRQLTKSQQKVIRLAVYSKWETHEIASLLGTGERNIQKLLQRALHNLKVNYVMMYRFCRPAGCPECISHNAKLALAVQRRNIIKFRRGRYTFTPIEEAA